MWASKISMELVQHGRIALQDQLSRLEAVADEFRVFVSETCKSHDCRGLICLGRVVLRCLKDKRLFSRSFFFTISTRHGIMESWNQYVWLANMICFRLLHWSQKQMTQGVSKIFSSYSLGFPFTWGLIRVFHSMFFVFFFRLSGLRAKIFGSTSPCCWKVSLWEAFRLRRLHPGLMHF